MRSPIVQTIAQGLMARLSRPDTTRMTVVVGMVLVLHGLALQFLSQMLYPKHVARAPIFMLTRLITPVSPSVPTAVQINAPARPAVQRPAPVPSWSLTLADTARRKPVEPVNPGGADAEKDVAAPLPPVAQEEAAAQPQTSSEDVTLPSGTASYLNNPQPVVPGGSRALAHSGRIVVRVLVGAKGRAQNVFILRSSGSDYLDRLVLETVRKWRFEPGRRKGQPEAMWLILPIDFANE